MSDDTKQAVRSMTGYASQQVSLPSAGELQVTLRAVNGRNLDLHLHLGATVAPFENSIRALLRARCGRGNIEVRVAQSAPLNQTVSTLDMKRLEELVQAFRTAQSGLGLAGEPDLNKLLGLPGVLVSNSRERDSVIAATEEEVLGGVAECLDELNRFREREGAELARAIRVLACEIAEVANRIIAIRAQALPEFQERLTERLRALLSDGNLTPNRLVEEAALLAARSDIGEELTRLQVHNDELQRLLEAGGAVGKRLDFLLQEMSRETNTVLSKTSGVGQAGLAVTNLGLELKAKIEGIREQSLNLE